MVAEVNHGFSQIRLKKEKILKIIKLQDKQG